MVKVPKLLLATAAGAYLVVGVATLTSAQNPNHLKCYKIKDPIATVKYTANLQGLSAEPGCTIKAQAKLLCVQTTKTAVSPSPPGGGPDPASAGRFLCYRVRCTKQALPGVPVSDQFGTRIVTPKTASMLCAPASPSGAFLDAPPF